MPILLLQNQKDILKDEALRAPQSWPQTNKQTDKQMKGHSKSDRLVWNGERTRTWMKNDKSFYSMKIHMKMANE